ncbi:hydrolase [Micromonospora sp. NPDC050200]|uniref:hydrolase n=1 Tax=Micromonospora sp. NPDC050200 TaxID=3155664 RepID=UPI0033E33582
MVESNGSGATTATRLTDDGARAIVAEHALAADRNRILSPPAVRAITDAGFPRHFVPGRFGGTDGTFVDFLHRVTVVAEGCAAAGWCASLFASHARMATFLPPEGQHDLWGEGPDVRISAGVVPGGTVAGAPGGYTLTGSWTFISGIDFADWVLVSGQEPDTTERRLRFFAVPRQHCTVDDTWFTVGMRGTGSRSVVLDDVFVPAHRSFRQESLLTGARPDAEHPLPFRLVNGLTMIAAPLGTTRAAVRVWSAWIAAKTEMSMGTVVRARDKASVQAALARASAAVDAAELLLTRIAALADAGVPIEPAVVARSHRDYAVVAESLTDAIERVLRSSGARAQAEDSPIQRAWRDVHTATSHAALQFDPNAAVYARHMLGAG